MLNLYVVSCAGSFCAMQFTCSLYVNTTISVVLVLLFANCKVLWGRNGACLHCQNFDLVRNVAVAVVVGVVAVVVVVAVVGAAAADVDTDVVGRDDHGGFVSVVFAADY